MADIERVEDVTRGLDAKQKEKVQTFFERQKKKLAERAEKSRMLAKQRGVVVGSIVSAVGGVAAEGIRRKIVGRYAQKVQNQGVGLAIVGVLAKVGAKWMGIPLMHDLGDSIIGQAGAVGTAEMIYGKDDAMVIALEGTTHAAEHPDKK